MIKYDQNQYVEIFYKLPPEIKDVVAASATTEHLWKIGQKHNLHIDKVGIMTDIAFDVMMGIIASKNFVAELQKELGISALDASVIARDIDENVFKPIKNTMVSLYGDRAPNKPSSTMVTLTEEDEEHEHLDKDLLLREIESPVIAKPRVEETKTQVKVEQKIEIPVEKVPAPKATMEVEEYHEEISKGETVPEIKPSTVSVEPKTPVADLASRSSLDRLADMKLSQTFVMPKNISSTASVAPTVAKTEAPVQAKTSVQEPKKEPAPIPEAPKAYSADPYREPLS